MRPSFLRGAVLAAALHGFLGAQAPMEGGPLPTREMFPFFLVSQAYQPVDPTPLGKGDWRIDLVHMRANTYELSEVFKHRLPSGPDGRLVVTRAYVEAHAGDYADQPFVFLVDEEVMRVEMCLRVGTGPDTDLWARLPVQSHEGGELDDLIEGFHKLGFKQFGRDLVTPNQKTLLVLRNGKVLFFNQEEIQFKVQDPTFGVTHRILERNGCRLAAYVSVKPPMTTSYGTLRSGLDPAVGLSLRWEPGPRNLWYAGLGGIWRTRGSLDYNQVFDRGFRSGTGAHLGWEWRALPTFHPFIQLYWQSGWLPFHPGQKLDRPSLQHDLGVHWFLWPRTTVTFRYLNNISHNANTADMGFGFTLSYRP